jgi:DNA-binding transcriptional ArsR family regulator
MPAPVQDVYFTPTTSIYEIKLEPALSNFHSLLLLVKSHEVSGLGAWITETADAMTVEEKERHRLVMHGLYYASRPQESWPSFPDYLDHLKNIQPERLQDKLLNTYAQCSYERENLEPVKYDKSLVLADFDSYMDFLRQCFDKDHIDSELESKAFAVLSEPGTLKELIHSHLDHMWKKYLREEWMRAKPMLEDAVFAFQQVDFQDMDHYEAFEFVTGRKIPEKWDEAFDNDNQITLIPSPHMGPYLGMIDLDDSDAWIFGARLPEGAQIVVPDLDRAEILVRLSALADDSRLQILKLISQKGEMRSQDIMRDLDMSQSATSRHLSQLNATGYLVARRCEGAKCYSMNSEKIDDTLNAVSTFLSVP